MRLQGCSSPPPQSCPTCRSNCWSRCASGCRTTVCLSTFRLQGCPALPSLTFQPTATPHILPQGPCTACPNHACLPTSGLQHLPAHSPCPHVGAPRHILPHGPCTACLSPDCSSTPRLQCSSTPPSCPRLPASPPPQKTLGRLSNLRLLVHSQHSGVHLHCCECITRGLLSKLCDAPLTVNLHQAKG